MNKIHLELCSSTNRQFSNVDKLLSTHFSNLPSVYYVIICGVTQNMNYQSNQMIALLFTLFKATIIKISILSFVSFNFSA